jgi:hypothetical protein
MTTDLALTLPRWSEVRDALARYDESRLRAAVTAVLRAPPATWQQDLDATISTNAGAWYGRGGWSIGNESFGSCACHSPVVNLRAANADPARLAPAVDWVVGEVRAMVECLRAFEAAFGRVKRGAEGALDEAEVTAAIDAIIDGVIDRTSCSESWYRYAGDGVTWLCDALGVPRDAIEAVVEASINTVFSSWTAPSPGPRRAAVRAVGEVLHATRHEPPEEVVGRVEGWLRPRRPRFAEACATIEGLEVQAAAEALVARGLLSDAWLDPSRSAFADFNKRARPMLRKTAGDARVYALLAADAEGAARAEALAHEVAHRLAVYGLKRAPTQVVWLLERDVPGYGYRRFQTSHPTLHLIESAAAALSGAADPRLDVDAWARAVKRLLPAKCDARDLRARCIEAATAVQTAVNAQRAKLDYEAPSMAQLWSASRWWTLLSDAGMRLPDREGLALFPSFGGDVRSLAKVVPEGARLRDLPNALAAIVSLWDTGYALHEIDAKRPALTLLIPTP